MAEKGNFKIYSFLYVEIKQYTIFVGFYSHENLKKYFSYMISFYHKTLTIVDTHKLQSIELFFLGTFIAFLIYIA